MGTFLLSVGSSLILDKYLVIILVIAFFLISLSIFLPSQKSLIAMYAIPEITTSERIVNITDKTLNLLDQKLDKYLGDTSNVKTEKE